MSAEDVPGGAAPGLDELAARGRVHLVGVAGAGMSAVGALLAARGLEVSGSDASGALDAVRAAGVTAHQGHDGSLVDGAGTLVVSSAIRPTNPEVARAGQLGVPVLHRSVALAALMAGRRGVAVAGAHGKTTTSAMVAVVLAHAGLDPSWAIGGTVRHPVGEHVDPVGGAHAGTGDVMVVEADESDGSFLAYRPEIAVVTNVEPDHLDHYGSREAFEQAFVDFAARVSGTLVVCADDPGAARLAGAARASGTAALTYGRGTADVRVESWHAVGDGGVVELTWPGEAPVVVRLAVPGAHNALNAAAAWSVARLLGVSAGAAADGLAAFVGTGRRFEDRGTAGGVRVVDDYAHHPTEIAALLRAARPVAGDGRVLVLFQPHLFSRTATFAAQFAEALALADAVVVTDVYAAREDPDPAVTGALITDRMGPQARFVADRTEAAGVIAALAEPGDLVLTVGAGDVTALAPVVLKALGER
ncbi:UDP-N-acetylmuramate--L-alanine ligase [Actinotalea sp. M2MS4P-6]|uniref:UDP-N-acetylmuramate--L-alanine ligase n=1 Tax=Actinotalea sp. M2MS4P-6 TaxID=2983762 RepID=UPI0021E3774E|nr:UDP-N-acetylmuramate--L-alanine ligase [Actinotalea sp. M2MS4P-6]MCV2393419.1 UDP-N-acetylmuramate--L-alanine ligase [Actinotalea sp. M2MS4P-6]